MLANAILPPAVDRRHYHEDNLKIYCQLTTEPHMNHANISIVSDCSTWTLQTVNGTCKNGTDLTTEQFADDADLPKVLELFLGVLLVCMILISFLGNSIVCFIVYQKSAMRSAINLLLANMAFSDICTATFSMTFSFSALFWKEHVLSPESCKAMLFLLDTFVSVGVFMILTISMDRYMIIVQRKDKLTTYRAKTLMVASWLVSMVMAFPSTVGWGDYKFVRSHTICVLTFDGKARDVGFMILKLCVTHFLPVLVMAFSFVQILGAVRKNKCRVHNHPNMDFSVSVISNNGRLGIPVLQRSFRVSLDMSFKTRAFKTILLLFITFVLCWTPYALNITISQSHGTFNRMGHLILLWIGYANSAINPIIYSIRIKKFRQVCSMWLPNRRKSRTNMMGATKRRINPSATYEFQDSSNTSN